MLPELSLGWQRRVIIRKSLCWSKKQSHGWGYWLPPLLAPCGHSRTTMDLDIPFSMIREDEALSAHSPRLGPASSVSSDPAALPLSFSSLFLSFFLLLLLHAALPPALHAFFRTRWCCTRQAYLVQGHARKHYAASEGICSRWQRRHNKAFECAGGASAKLPK